MRSVTAGNKIILPSYQEDYYWKLTSSDTAVYITDSYAGYVHRRKIIEIID